MDGRQPHGGRQPFGTRAEASQAFADHVDAGKTAALQAIDFDVVMGERAGARFADAYDGRWFWNCHCNGGVFNLGHRNERVIAATKEALDHVDVGNHHLISGWRAHLARQLADTTDGRLPHAVFGSSGAEAVDVALKVARGVTGRTTIVSAQGAYHGSTGYARSAGDPHFDELFGSRLPGFEQVPFDDLAALDAAIDGETAAVILESIPATLGFPLPSAGYLRAVGELAHSRWGVAGARRGPDGPGAHGHHLALPATRCRARHGDHRQGPERRGVPDVRGADDERRPPPPR